MTENGDPYENAVAERINDILKQEYLDGHSVASLEAAKKALKHTVKLYNEERPHMSIGNLTPQLVHQENLVTEKLWKKKVYFHKVNPEKELLKV